MSKKKDEYLNISPWKFLFILLFLFGIFMVLIGASHILGLSYEKIFSIFWEAIFMVPIVDIFLIVFGLVFMLIAFVEVMS
jgi:hypothetical protein